MPVLRINTSPGGIPKRSLESCRVFTGGLDGDGHNHEKHNHPDLAVSLLDVEQLEVMRDEGFDLGPGATGENVTLEGVDVQSMALGDRLLFVNPDGSAGPELELTKLRKPCYVLDAIDPALQSAAVGRLGYLARVLREGTLVRGADVRRLAGDGTP